MPAPRVTPALAALAAGVSLTAAGCTGSSAPSDPGPSLIGTTPAGATSPAPSASSVAAQSSPCERPSDGIRSALATRLDDDVEVRNVATVTTDQGAHGLRVIYLAGVVYRCGDRVGVAVWASATPTQSDAWLGVDAAAQQASHVVSAAGTNAALANNLADYSHVSSCATLGF